jgi:hypothetical protein
MNCFDLAQERDRWWTLAYVFLSLLFIFSGSAAQRGLWPPRTGGFLITRNDAPQSVELLWTSDQFTPKTST